MIIRMSSPLKIDGAWPAVIALVMMLCAAVTLFALLELCGELRLIRNELRSMSCDAPAYAELQR